MKGVQGSLDRVDGPLLGTRGDLLGPADARRRSADHLEGQGDLVKRRGEMDAVGLVDHEAILPFTGHKRTKSENNFRGL